MRISSIDVGSNAIRLIIAEINTATQAPNQWTVIKKFRSPLRLGTGVFNESMISSGVLAQLILTFKKIARINKKYKAKKTLCVATSAMRDAKNSKKVIQAVKAQTGIKIRVIDGITEARYIQQSVLKSNVVNFKETLFIDIGGGSVEFTAFKNDRVIANKSYPLGAVRLLDKIQNHGMKLETEALKYLKQFSRLTRTTHFKNAIGTGGNFDALSKLKLALLRKAPHTNLTLTEVEMIYARWGKLTLAQKLKLDVRRDRIDILDIALPLIIQTLGHFKINRLKIPNTGLKEGLIHSVLS